MSETGETVLVETEAEKAARGRTLGVALVALAWFAAAGVAIKQYVDVRRTLDQPFVDASAIQIQQLNSDAMLVIAVAMVCALGVTAVAMVARR